MQAEYVVQNLAKVAEAAGTKIDQIAKCQFYETDLLNFYTCEEVWIKYVGLPPTRSSMACRSLLVPGALFAVNTLILIADEQHQKEEIQAGIAWHPEQVRNVHFSPGITAGDWLFTAGQMPIPDFGVHDWVRAPDGLPHYYDDIEFQTDGTMDLLVNQLTANGLTLDEIVEAKVYLIDLRRDYRGFVRAWERIFASTDRMPAVSVMPSTQADGSTGIMMGGPTIEIDLISKRGG